MIVVVTRNVPDKFRGFLASCMLEVAPSVYVSPNITKAVRERVWGVLSKWFSDVSDGSILMVYKDSSEPTGVGVSALGLPPRHIIDADGVALSYLAKND
jgi:CRISPR-associated protein Cas2